VSQKSHTDDYLKRSQSDTWLDLPLWPLAGLAQNEERCCAGREAGGRGRFGQRQMAVQKAEKTWTHFTFRIDTWSANGESIIEHVAGVEDYQIALATYRAACERWLSTPITLCQGSRVIEDSRRLRLAWAHIGERASIVSVGLNPGPGRQRLGPFPSPTLPGAK
jgi:hypothetical protein